MELGDDFSMSDIENQPAMLTDVSGTTILSNSEPAKGTGAQCEVRDNTNTGIAIGEQSGDSRAESEVPDNKDRAPERGEKSGGIGGQVRNHSV